MFDGTLETLLQRLVKISAAALMFHCDGGIVAKILYPRLSRRWKVKSFSEVIITSPKGTQSVTVTVLNVRKARRKIILYPSIPKDSSPPTSLQRRYKVTNIRRRDEYVIAVPRISDVWGTHEAVRAPGRYSRRISIFVFHDRRMWKIRL